MQLTKNFTISELVASGTAAAHGIDNTPTSEQIDNLRILANALQQVRDLLGHPIIVTSGYRSTALNRAIGGSTSSSHAEGLAADFTCPEFGTVQQTCEAIRDSSLPFDQLIYEQKPSVQWVHLGMGSKMRRDVLSWSKKSGYVPGIISL